MRCYNFGRLLDAAPAGVDIQLHAFQADWNEQSTYQTLLKRACFDDRPIYCADPGSRPGYHVLVANPPYLPENEFLPLRLMRSGYEQTPKEALMAGPDGLDGYWRVGALAALLAPQAGVGISVRFPVIRHQDIPELMHPDDYYGDIHDAVWAHFRSQYLQQLRLRTAISSGEAAWPERQGLWYVNQYLPDDRESVMPTPDYGFYRDQVLGRAAVLRSEYR